MEALGEARRAWVALEQAESEGVEGEDLSPPEEDSSSSRAMRAPHLVGGLLGEGHGENARGVDALPDQMDEAAGQRARLPEPGPARVS